jgi:hypothetical protein
MMLHLRKEPGLFALVLINNCIGAPKKHLFTLLGRRGNRL